MVLRAARPFSAVTARSRPSHRGAWCGLLAAAVILAFGAPRAEAFVLTDIIDFNLTESTQTYGTYSISSTGNNSAYYRWLDDPDHTTAISGNSCGDLALYGKADIPAHNTSYYYMFTGFPYLCFALRGRTAPGAGNMFYHDGRLKR